MERDLTFQMSNKFNIIDFNVLNICHMSIKFVLEAYTGNE